MSVKKYNILYKKYNILYKKILSAIPNNLFINKDGVKSCAIDIYFTALGVRPSCIPFDGEVKYGGKCGDEMLKSITKNIKCLDKLKKIKEITVIIGNYYDTGEQIVICNTKLLKENYFDTIFNKLEKSYESLGASRGALPETHILIGKMLGYICPLNIIKLYETYLYDIKYIINNREHMGCWCLYEEKYIKKDIKLLKIMNSVLNLIGEVVEIKISIIKR